MLIVPMPIPLDVIGNSTEDYALTFGGLAVPVELLLDVGTLALEVRLVAALKAGVDANVSMVVMTLRDDGAFVPIPASRLVHAKPTWAKLASPWIRVEARDDIIGFGLYGRATNDAGFTAVPTLLLRAMR